MTQPRDAVPEPEHEPEDDDDRTAPRPSAAERDSILRGIVKRAGERGGGRGLAADLDKTRGPADA